MHAGANSEPGFDEVLTFWFGAPDSPELGRRRKSWFEKNPAFDGEIRKRFLGRYGEAAVGRLDSWVRTPRAALALVVMLDQFPRNMFRGDARSFATDLRALEAAKGVVALGWDELLRPVERVFVYLPFEDSEDLATQRHSLRLFAQLPCLEQDLADNYDYALRHHDIIARFGRFPHRNTILGRESSRQEFEFLKQPDSSF